MYFNDYQLAAKKFAQFEHDMYPKVSLVMEAAELCDLFVKRDLRGDDKVIEIEDIKSEAGDVLWNLAVLLSQHGITLNEVAVKNIAKLQDRADRGVIKGDGGDR